MKKLTILLILSILCMMTIPVMAQEEKPESPGREQVQTHEDSDYTHIPFSLSFLPGVSTGGLMGGDIITNVSINIIAGRYAKLHGVEFGSVLNWEMEEVCGAQFSGVANIVEGDVRGFQSGGALNVVLGDLDGLQASGAVNYARGCVRIGQLGGAVNIALGDLKGIQASGAINYVGGNIKGVQTGVINYVNPMGDNVNKVAQIGVVNIGGDVSGTQIGVVNIGRKVEGAQVGVVNYAEELSGVPVGVFSFVRKGRLNVDVWGSETAPMNIGLKTGGKYVYGILAVGTQPFSDLSRWFPGVGIGGHIPFGSKFVNVEALSFQINEGEAWTDETHVLNKFRLIGGWQVQPRLAVFAGVTLNVFVSQVNDGDHIAIGSFYDSVNDDGDRWVRMWPGFVAGVQF